MDRLSRRKFIRRSFEIAVAGHILPVGSRLLGDESAPNLVVVRGESAPIMVKAAIDRLGGIGRFVKPKSTVLLKPNASFPNPPEWCTTTNPEVVGAVARTCIEAGARRVIIADHPLRTPERCFKRTGMDDLQLAKGIYVKILSEETDYQPVELRGKELKTVRIAKLALKADTIINLPVAKSHSATGVSFSMKNLMGLVWDRAAFHGGDLHLAIAELAGAIRSHLILLDATRVLLDKGPEGPGKVQQMNTLVAGVDPVAVDSYATTLATWNNRRIVPSDIGYIVHATEMKLGRMDIDNLNISEVNV